MLPVLAPQPLWPVLGPQNCGVSDAELPPMYSSFLFSL